MGLKDELTGRGVNVSHNVVWLFLRSEGLRFKRLCSRLSRPAPTSLTGGVAGGPGKASSSGTARLPRRDLDQGQHGAAARIG